MRPCKVPHPRRVCSPPCTATACMPTALTTLVQGISSLLEQTGLEWPSFFGAEVPLLVSAQACMFQCDRCSHNPSIFKDLATPMPVSVHQVLLPHSPHKMNCPPQACLTHQALLRSQMLYPPPAAGLLRQVKIMGQEHPGG